MIRSESEYMQAMEQIAQHAARLKQERAKLQQDGLCTAEVKRLLDPSRSFQAQLKEEVASYERLKRGDFDELHNFDGLGQLLIALRIASGVSQRELAERLAVHESQISRDERNEYHGVTVERAARILEALGVDLRTSVGHVTKVSA